MTASGAPIWRLNSGADRRIKAGHPWVYSNELQKSPKGITPGQKIMLADAGGKFLAWGYGNPSSLIAFRVLSRLETDTEAGTVRWFKERLKSAWTFRKDLGLDEESFRWVHGEGDGLPGLIVDRYLMSQTKTPTEVIVVQAHTAGMDALMGSILESIEMLMNDRETPWGLVIRNDSASRKFEGLEIQEPVIHRKWEGNNIIQVRGVGRKPIPFKVDLKAGQKTGFFLDQAENINQVGEILIHSDLLKLVRILDFCPYVGQWSAKLTQALRAHGHDVHVTLMDSSKDALHYAEENVKNAGGQVKAIQGDVMEDLKNLSEKSFDVVISDPPAFIKGRKDMGPGTAAYVKLNTEVFRLVAPSGFVAACSCSQLLGEEEFMTVLSKAARRNNRDCRWIARGTQAMDHPVRLEFNEGKYLKMWFGKVSE